MVTMFKKIEPTYSYKGCGFPVTITNAPMKKVRGEWVLDIDPMTIAANVIARLTLMESKLSGAQVRYIRHFLGMNQRDFAKVLSVSQVMVCKWEAFDQKPTSMDTNTERVLRVYLMHRMEVPLKEMVKVIQAVFYRPKTKQPVSLDASLLKSA